MANVPSNPEAEECVLGAMLLSRPAVEIALEIISSTDFYVPVNMRIFSAIEDLYEHGEPIDSLTVFDKCAALGMAIADPVRLVGLMNNVPSVGNVRHYAKAVEKASVARYVMRIAQEALGAVTEGADPFEVADEITKSTLSIGSKDLIQQALTIKELAALDTTEGDPVIKGLINSDHRVIFVAREGQGKSTILRSIGMKASQGIHPFKHHSIPAIRTLVVDAENPRQNILQNAEHLDRELEAWSSKYESERFRIFRKPGGMNILNRRDRTELQREIALHRPDLVCAGPVYKMFRKPKGADEAESADAFLNVWDDLRVKYGFALILEMHAAKGEKGDRVLDPMGSMRFLAWPDAGFGLYDNRNDPLDTTLTVKRFRGDRVQGMRFPDRIYRNTQWIIEGGYDGTA